MNDKNFNKLNAREECLKSLINYEKDKKYSNIELSASLEKNNFNELDRGFFTKLFYGVIEKKFTLDYYIKLLCDKNKKIENDILNILRMGLYQIVYMDKVPDNAACNESVELAKKFKPNNVKIGGFVNAVLRNFIRNREKYEEYVKNADLEIKYSCSSGIIKIWEDSYGFETAVKLLEESQSSHGLAITVNSLKIQRDEYLEKLKNLGIKCEKISEYGVNILEDLPVRNLYGFDEGLFFVQDEASQICALETGAKSGDLIIDCCAAPGGKSFFIGQMIKNNGRIICFDIHENKINLIKKSAERLGVDIIELYGHDSVNKFKLKDFDLKADVVLCDVPCSGLGVVSKKPEIKYKTPEEISRLPELQYKILAACSDYVKPGGTLVYSTCTLNKRENEAVAEKFLRKNKNFECVSQKTFFPFERKIDGFFLAKLKRIGV